MDDEIPLLNTLDIEILMHRDAHFSGNFDIMIKYYEGDGVGVMPDFPIRRLKELKKMPTAEIVPPTEQEKVEKAKHLYLELRSVYGKSKPSDLPTLISDLILSEEEDPVKEKKALARHGAHAVPTLIDLIRSDTFYDPLFPGYGRAPLLAAETLGMLGDSRAIAPLFEALGQESFFTDEAMIKALGALGEKARIFLLAKLDAKPYTKDNEHAAIALTALEESERVGEKCLKMLKDDNPFFAQYLIFGCAGLKGPKHREEFKSLAASDKYTGLLKQEMEAVIKSWR